MLTATSLLPFKSWRAFAGSAAAGDGTSSSSTSTHADGILVSSSGVAAAYDPRVAFAYTAPALAPGPMALTEIAPSIEGYEGAIAPAIV